MKRRTVEVNAWGRAGASAAVLGAVLGGCNDADEGPELFGGAGLRVSLPAGTDTLAWIRVGLWDRNATLPPDCQAAPSASPWRAQFFPEDTGTDQCTLKQVTIWNYVGERVRFIESIPFSGSLSYGWDTRDDAGNFVSSGYYPVFSRCLDSQGVFTFTGNYYVLRDADRGACDWPLWLRRFEPPPSERTLELVRFPLYSAVQILDEGGGGRNVPFLNPFLVKVEAPGMIPFETEVWLEADRFSLVSVTLTPEDTTAAVLPAGTGAGRETR